MAMNKTDALLWTQRLHEAIRKLPDDARIHAFETRYESDLGLRIEIHLSAPIEWPAVFDGKEFGYWIEKRIVLTPFAFAWWAVDKEDGDDGTAATS